MKAKMILILVLLSVCIIANADDWDVPLLTDNAGNMINQDFDIVMSNLPENYRENIYGTLTFGIGHVQDGLFCFMSGGMHFIQLTDWLYLPLMVGLATNDASSSGYSSMYAGSGILIRTDYFSLGLKGGVSGTYKITDDTYIFFFGDDYKFNYDYGIYPSFNIKKYPFFRYLETIRGYLVPNDPTNEISHISYFGYSLEFLFKNFLGLPTFDIYTNSGINKFMIGWDFSSFPMILKPTGDVGGNKLEYGSLIDHIGERHGTISYGFRIGFWNSSHTEHHIFDLNYLLLDTPVEYNYPYGLNGFPSITYSIMTYANGGDFFYNEIMSGGLYARFSTINFTGKPYLPDIGLFTNVGQTAVNMMFSFPFTLTFSMRMSLKHIK